MVIMGNSVIDLQNNLNKLQIYCDVWGLKVNVAITKNRRLQETWAITARRTMEL